VGVSESTPKPKLKLKPKPTMIRALLIDLDGVVYRGEQPIAGARESIHWLQRQGIPFLFVTNTTSRPRRKIREKLEAMGIRVMEERILTPVVVAAQWLKAHTGGPVAFFVREGTREDLKELPALETGAEKGAQAVVVGDLGPGWDFHTLNRAFRLLMEDPQLPLLALGMTRYWQAPEGLMLDVAPFVKALEHAAGREALILGKPSAAFFSEALSILGVQAGEALMLGDDIIIDVGGAQDAGLRGGLVQTGKYRPADLDGPVQPDVVLPALAELPERWRQWSTQA
jgi:HAD superfamily hydrolase (TIGR01458 family)